MRNKGFSLVELIVVIAIIAIVSGAATIGINYLALANSKKAIISIDTEISEVRLEDMSQREKSYVYLAADSGAVYMRKTTDASITSYVSSDEWKKVLASGRTMHYETVTDGGIKQSFQLDETGASGRSIIKFGFNKGTGALLDDNGEIYDKIWTMNGSSTGSSIILVPLTGKHYVNVE